MEIISLSTLDVEELACHITELDYEEIDADEEVISEKLYEEFGCDLVQFTHIIQRLLPLIDIGHSPISDTKYKGFADKKSGTWFVKTERI